MISNELVEQVLKDLLASPADPGRHTEQWTWGGKCVQPTSMLCEYGAAELILQMTEMPRKQITWFSMLYFLFIFYTYTNHKYPYCLGYQKLDMCKGVCRTLIPVPDSFPKYIETIQNTHH